MGNFTILLVLISIMALLNALADRFKLSSPIVLIIAGIAMGFIPFIPTIEIDPGVVFLLFLPPLLYDAAFNLHFKDFRENLNTISSMAFGLVFLTTVGIAVIAHYIIPGMSWPLAFVLGAILSSTDAVAALSITKGLGLSPLTITILEGESLLNDASALVAYRYATAAVTGAAFIWWKASFTFLILIGGGIVIGLVIAKILATVLRLIRNQILAVLSYTLLAPFITYLLAEELHCSAVIAVVALGLSISKLSEARFPEELKRQSASIWELLVFLLNGLIFVLIGLELPVVVKSISYDDLWKDAAYALLITVTALIIRMVRVFSKKEGLQRGFNHPNIKNSKQAISAFTLLGLQESLVISWSGMRGIVSLAVAIGLPKTLVHGQPFPMRGTIIYITTVVVLITIVGQGLLLPILMKKINAQQSCTKS
ncbi:Na+/H+ antiporter [Mucilaginibacter robiniae]|uniref:Na+/H+ antiporter n=1 Tax=Mucilaginibacter robiniae TaxID=2728022 RepID=A0A7L5EBX7_9SPHI|nr:Na+/H+ antiporter [Mucilaginibacter robiniae]QJD97916.1 Na+/H+ antiporter [Mucilaginibacter robiniae]